MKKLHYELTNQVTNIARNIQELDYKYDAMDSLYQFTKSAKIDFKTAKKAKLTYVFNSVFVTMATSHVILQRFLFLDQVIQELYSKYDAMN